MTRLAKFIAHCGIASRRDAEKLILSGAVSVNGKIINSPATDILDSDIVVVNGEKISSPFTINAIGFAERLASLNSSDGYLKRLEQYGIKSTFKPENEIVILKNIRGNSFKYAKTIK